MKTETKNLLSLSNIISLEDFSLENKEAGLLFCCNKIISKNI